MYQAYVINLAERKDRWENIQKSFPEKDIKLERFSALKGRLGPIYCALSHIEILKKAKEQKLPFVIVFEDDNLPTETFSRDFPKIVRWLTENKDSWHIFNGNPTYFAKNDWNYFRKIPGFLKKHNENLIKQIHSEPHLIKYSLGMTTNCVIYNDLCYDRIIDQEKIYRNYIKNRLNYIKQEHKYDVLLCNMDFIHVTCYPFITKQADGYSDILRTNVNYDSALNKSMLYIDKNVLI
ncbi:MAG: glycosyltransferase family 25 protein [Romboutsia sp.]|nr:glycosyltransferase family 25 protein [Romboutsia sp.]